MGGEGRKTELQSLEPAEGWELWNKAQQAAGTVTSQGSSQLNSGQLQKKGVGRGSGLGGSTPPPPRKKRAAGGKGRENKRCSVQGDFASLFTVPGTPG